MRGVQFPEVGELLLHRLLKQWVRAFKRNDKPVILAVSKFVAHLTNQQVRRGPPEACSVRRHHHTSLLLSRAGGAALRATRAASRMLPYCRTHHLYLSRPNGI